MTLVHEHYATHTHGSTSATLVSTHAHHAARITEVI